MSEKAAGEWLKRMVSEPELAKQVVNLNSEEEMFALAKKHGCDFTQEEWSELTSHVDGRLRDYAKENNIEISDELTEEQLAAIAGGGLFGWIIGGMGAALGAAVGAIVGGSLSGGTAAVATGATVGGFGLAAGKFIGEIIDSKLGT